MFSNNKSPQHYVGHFSGGRKSLQHVAEFYLNVDLLYMYNIIVYNIYIYIYIITEKSYTCICVCIYIYIYVVPISDLCFDVEVK